MAIHTILVAFDFSEPSSRALERAHQLCQATGAALQLVHVHPELYDGRGNPELGLPWPSQGQKERYLRFLEQEIAAQLDRQLGPAAAATKIHVAHGDPVKRVLEYATEVGADMLCVGSTGKGAVQRVLLGSISQSILRGSLVPVLVVH